GDGASKASVGFDPVTVTALSMRRMTFFERLGLRKDATSDDVKAAYRASARTFHPDKNRANPQADELFKLIKEANDVLSNDKARAKYETKLELESFNSYSNPYASSTLRSSSVIGDILRETRQS